MTFESLTQPLAEVISIRPRLIPTLGRLDITRPIDLLNHFPRAWNRRAGIADLRTGEKASVVAEVVSCVNKPTRRRRMKLTELVVKDDTGVLKAVFFNQPWLTSKFTTGRKIKLSGVVEFAFNEWTMKPSTWDFNVSESDTGLEAEYPLTEGMFQPDILALIDQCLPLAEFVPDPLPDAARDAMRLMPIDEAYRQIHKPENDSALKAAQLALKYREFFLLQCGLRLRRRSESQDTNMTIDVTDDLRSRACKYFPFELTDAQKRVIVEIEDDLATPGRMHRLLQGDVGSGKTAVALYACLLLIDAGYQCALLAPTEVLARQHLRSFSAYLEDTKVRIELLLGGMKKPARNAMMSDLADGRIHILVGTHALFEDYVTFKNLGLCVMDEQHKFGVKQRAALRAKGNRPHVLAMSATPIPRTLSMTLYGAMDVSIIDELPPGRTPVETEWAPASHQEQVFAKIRSELADGGRAYFIYPLVDESESLELKSAVQFADELVERFPDSQVGLVHGQMSTDEKDRVVDAFRRGDVQILAATVVVEVGVDVPEANIMVIENAERFGLSQLHQLRGRVGRGRRQSYLYLFGDPRTEESVKRIEVLCSTTDGFKIAEEDLKMRGFGDFVGTRQSGLPKLHIGDVELDSKILMRAQRDVAKGLERLDEAHIRRCLDLQFGRDHRLVDV